MISRLLLPIVFAAISACQTQNAAKSGLESSPSADQPGAFVGCVPEVGEGCAYSCPRMGEGVGIKGGENCAKDELACYCPSLKNVKTEVPEGFKFVTCEREPIECKRLCDGRGVFYVLDRETCIDPGLSYACYCEK
jgi:hypothetical protein